MDFTPQERARIEYAAGHLAGARLFPHDSDASSAYQLAWKMFDEVFEGLVLRGFGFAEREDPSPTASVGDRVVTVEGEPFSGTVLSTFTNLAGELRVVVESEQAPGTMRIFSPARLEWKGPAPVQVE